MSAAGTTVRPCRAADRPFVLATVERLGAFDTPSWRTPREIWEGEARTLRGWFDGDVEGTLLLAERDEPLGFIFLEHHVDYFTLEGHGHIGILAVAAAAEGTGAGRALLEAGEAWARNRGYRRLTLNVFEKNTRARGVYDRFGFQVETMRYCKQLP
jgi:GNAT superfamily N-acetyltransferase